MVIAIEATSQRDDWHSIPELLGKYNDVRREAAADHVPAAKEALARFRRTAMMSADLVPTDAERIVKRVSKLVEKTLAARLQAGGLRVALPEFRGLNLYGDDMGKAI
jgi:hypothetical protein